MQSHPCYQVRKPSFLHIYIYSLYNKSLQYIRPSHPSFTAHVVNKDGQYLYEGEVAF